MKVKIDFVMCIDKIDKATFNETKKLIFLTF